MTHLRNTHYLLQAFHLAIDQPTHVFLERVEKLFDAVDQCADAEYAGPSTRILLTPAAAAPPAGAIGVGAGAGVAAGVLPARAWLALAFCWL